MKKSILNFSQLAEQYEILPLTKTASLKGGTEDINGGDLGTVIITPDGFDWSNFYGGIAYNSGSFIFGTSSGGGSSTEGSGGGIQQYAQGFQSLGFLADEASIIAASTNNIAALKMFGKLSIIAQTAGFTFDSVALYDHYQNNQGNMDAVRFSIKTTGTTMSIIAGSAVGGPPGILLEH
ncbi:hypothetical protein [Pedobacter punctiformis]|uniref:Uncharacterized protein n=1 Tax=Pedobacter punctiformis TaxID=3004097 RepID=A0ABT4L6I0_9SPHI|nr:hypothetical protein [Pedobacter sp. HCMS5-2]MCZ4243532.1 hypothetical protein [Pedobacter sp. HCMS5-2]